MTTMLLIKSQLDLKLDKSTYTISNSLPGIPVLDKISIALIASLTVIDANSDDKTNSWTDPVNNIKFTQTVDSKKPILMRDASKKRHFLRFDGVDDYLEVSQYDVSDVAGEGDTCTVMLVINTKNVTSQSQFQWGSGQVRFGVHIPWGDGTVYIDFGSVANGRLSVASLANLTGNIEVWTIRVDKTEMQLFRGCTSMTPIKTQTISASLTGSAQPFFIGAQVDANGDSTSHCEMDLYAFAVWSKTLTDNELKNMFRFIQNHFDL